MTENLAGNLTHRSILGNNVAAPTTQGGRHEPMEAGTTVHGGIRRRMRGRK